MSKIYTTFIAVLQRNAKPAKRRVLTSKDTTLNKLIVKV